MTAETLAKAKLALRIADGITAYDGEITDLVEAAKQDLTLAGVTSTSESDPIVLRAILTYVRMYFGSPANYDELRAAYYTQRDMLRSATGYTDWEATV